MRKGQRGTCGAIFKILVERTFWGRQPARDKGDLRSNEDRSRLVVVCRDRRLRQNPRIDIPLKKLYQQIDIHRRR